MYPTGILAFLIGERRKEILPLKQKENGSYFNIRNKRKEYVPEFSSTKLPVIKVES